MSCYPYPFQHAVNNQQVTKRGVLWDQEIYDPFYYNQDRTFFHSFELEGCLAGLSFMDEKEAKQFKKKMDERENNASKQTKLTPFQGLSPGLQPSGGHQTQGRAHGLFGGISSLLSGQRSSSAPHVSHQSPPSIISQRETNVFTPPSPYLEKRSALADIDPKILDDLVHLGIPRDQLEEHIDFIKDYIEEQKSGETPKSNSTHDASNENVVERRAKAPPPPPPAFTTSTSMKFISPQNTGSTQSKRGPPPAPPPSRRSRPESQNTIGPSSHQPSSPPDSPARTPSPPRPVVRFKAPPAIADAGKYAHITAPVLPARPRATSNATNLGPTPPPRPPKTPMDDEPESRSRFNVPPPFHGERYISTAPPAPPSRMPLRPSPRASREPSGFQSATPAAGAPPPLPPKTPNAPIYSVGSPLSQPIPAPLPSHRNVPSAPVPPPLPSMPRMVPSLPISLSGPPVPTPPTIPHSSGPPPPPLPGSAGPFPPPLPSSGARPTPPLSHGGGLPQPPAREPTAAPPRLMPTPGKEDVLASIRASGGIKGLKRVSSQEKRDRSAAAVPGVAGGSSSGSGATSAPSAGGGLAEALAAALSERNKKVSASGMLSEVSSHIKIFG